jgi:hypothetical protein
MEQVARQKVGQVCAPVSGQEPLLRVRILIKLRA